MLGAVSVPHWFRRAISFLNTEVPHPQMRTAGSRYGAQRARMRDVGTGVPTIPHRRGPKVLEDIVTSWEVQQRNKVREVSAPPRRPRRTW